MDFTRLTPNENTNPAMGMAVKWVPRAWQSSNGLGEWQGGLKLAGGYEQPQGDARHVANTSLLGLVTLTVSPALTLHANVGHLRDRDRRQNATLFNVALTLAPTDVLLLFAETQTNDRRALFGATVNAIGGRWWLIKGRLGFDITASRRVGSTEGTTWTAGLGWYGIAF